MLHQNRIVTLSANAAATSFDILRTKILLQMREQGWTRAGGHLAAPGLRQDHHRLQHRPWHDPPAGSECDTLRSRPASPRVWPGRWATRPEHSIREMIAGNVDFPTQAVRIGSNLALSMARTPMADPTSMLLDTGHLRAA